MEGVTNPNLISDPVFSSPLPFLSRVFPLFVSSRPAHTPPPFRRMRWRTPATPDGTRRSEERATKRGERLPLIFPDCFDCVGEKLNPGVSVAYAKKKTKTRPPVSAVVIKGENVFVCIPLFFPSWHGDIGKVCQHTGGGSSNVDNQR